MKHLGLLFGSTTVFQMLMLRAVVLEWLLLVAILIATISFAVIIFRETWVQRQLLTYLTDIHVCLFHFGVQRLPLAELALKQTIF
jgi:hypothetical protein